MAMTDRQAILGLGVTGYSLLRHLAREGSTNLVVADTRERPPMLEAAMRDFPHAEYVCGRASRHMAWHDVQRVYVSPGIPLDACMLASVQRLGIPIDSDIGRFLRLAKAPVFAVTGTNGKSTVCSLAGHLMRGLGINVAVGGNLGRPALDLLETPAPLYLLELSSFQLERLGSEHLHLGAMLNVAPDHADRYGDFDGYVEAKRRIFKGAEISVENRQDPMTATFDAPTRLSFGVDAPPQARDTGLIDGKWLALGERRIAPLDQLGPTAGHACANALAALLLASEAGGDARAAGDHLASFEGLPHRMQTVAVHQGVRWIDDSKATNPAAAVSAVQSLAPSAGDGRILLILGGDAKGAELTPLGECIGAEVAGACLLGKDAPHFREALEGRTELFEAESMEEAVFLCAQRARSGDHVLLSPAAASLDMFENFEERGQVFAKAVRALSE